LVLLRLWRALGSHWHADHFRNLEDETVRGHAASQPTRLAIFETRYSFGASGNWVRRRCGNLDVARDRAALGRGVGAQIEHHVIDVAVAPAFRRIIALDDRVLGVVVVLGSVPVRRGVAAADMAAGAAEAQMHPGRADFQTFLAAECAGR